MIEREEFIWDTNTTTAQAKYNEISETNHAGDFMRNNRILRIL